MVNQMVAVGEESGSLDAMCERTPAAVYRDSRK
jgi:type II secretory pathway component PulF